MIMLQPLRLKADKLERELEEWEPGEWAAIKACREGDGQAFLNSFLVKGDDGAKYWKTEECSRFYYLCQKIKEAEAAQFKALFDK